MRILAMMKKSLLRRILAMIKRSLLRRILAKEDPRKGGSSQRRILAKEDPRKGGSSQRRTLSRILLRITAEILLTTLTIERKGGFHVICWFLQVV
jgi:hypothetical protein